MFPNGDQTSSHLPACVCARLCVGLTALPLDSCPARSPWASGSSGSCWVGCGGWCGVWEVGRGEPYWGPLLHRKQGSAPCGVGIAGAWCSPRQLQPGHQASPSRTSMLSLPVPFSHSVMSDSLRPRESQHARPPCPSPTHRVYSNSCPLSR